MEVERTALKKFSGTDEIKRTNLGCSSRLLKKKCLPPCTHTEKYRIPLKKRF
jgi:hypothetical protein